MKKSICLILVCLFLLGMGGCSRHTQEEKTTNTGDLFLTNSILGEDHQFTYPEAPQRIVSLASPATEMLLALGLEDSIVGYAMQDNEIPARYKAAFDALYCITKDWTVSKEMILALEPDFLMFWNGSADYDYEFLTANGISTYTMTSDISGAKIGSVYDDFTNMGKIFGREDRASEIIASMQAKIDPVAARTEKLTPVSVAYVDAYSTEEAVFTAGDALVADIFRAAGAENVMNHTDDPWMNVSWEEMAAADPEWIVIGIYEGVEDADYWIEYLENHPAMRETGAVKEDRYIVVGLADLTVGERIADTVGLLASYFHPEG